MFEKHLLLLILACQAIILFYYLDFLTHYLQLKIVENIINLVLFRLLDKVQTCFLKYI